MSDPSAIGPLTSLTPEVIHDAEGGVATTFTVWAPWARTVRLDLAPPPTPSTTTDLSAATTPNRPNSADGSGYWTVTVPGVRHGWRYRYLLDDEPPLPDPASGWQPDGVHGASAVVDTHGFGTGHAWTDSTWRGIDLVEAVIAELHIGTFTPEGTFDAAIGQLDRLALVGINTVELMPVNAVPGTRNWGYDGVFPFAVQESYGGPAGLARFVDAAHARGIAVLLDVVYNHLGPEGNVLHRYGPYFTDAYSTPWGPAVNVAGPGSDGVRRYIVENVRRWIRAFHIDGFRLDAVHAVVDPTANSIWEQIANAAHAEGATARRRTIVIAESSDNDPRFVRGADRGGYGLDGVWNDDVHHSLRVALIGERTGYYADYEGTAAELADIIEHRWLFRDRWSTFRGRHHGRAADDVAPHRFITYSLTHDQVGNRPAGDRPDLAPAQQRLAAAMIALLPSTPMLFMGQEYGDPAPFPFFVDHGDPEILEATRRGRRDEFAHADWAGEVPDPGDPGTRDAAVLDPSLADREPHRSLLALHSEAYRLRREITTVRSPAAHQKVEHHDAVVLLSRWLPGAASTLLVNLGDRAVTVPLPAAHGDRPVEIALDTAAARWSTATADADAGPTGTGASTTTATLVDDTEGRLVQIAPMSTALVVG